MATDTETTPTQWVTPAEAAELLNAAGHETSARTVRHWCQNDAIRAMKLPNDRWKIDLSALDPYLGA